MATPTYIEKLREVREVFPDAAESLPLDAPLDAWTPAEKGQLTRLYHSAQLLAAPSVLADVPRKSAADYRYMLETVRPFASGFSGREGFRLGRLDELTPSQKAKLTRTYRELSSLAARPFYPFRSRDPKRLRAVQEAIGQPTSKNVRVALVPVPTTSARPTIRLRDGEVRIKIGNVEKRLIRWDDFGLTAADLAADPEGATRRVVTATGFKRYGIQAGDYEVKAARAPMMLTGEQVAREVQKLVAKYSQDNGYDPENPSSSHYRNWLFGLTGYNFDELKEIQDYRRSARRQNVARNEKRKARRRALARRRK